ncbi:hypothetical protein [Pseudochryseolinea flava]|nr:hypothetical protein [Pseudochryseolinea flava]
MKHTYYTFFFAMLICNACSVGVKKDLGTGLFHTVSGFSVDEVLLVGPDNQTKSDNVVNFNSTVAIVAQGLRGYELKEGKAFPGLMLQVTDGSGTAVINEADLFANTEGYSPEDASIIRGTVTVGAPMKAGETYHVKMRIWDKNKIETELTAEIDIKVKE